MKRFFCSRTVKTQGIGSLFYYGNTYKEIRQFLRKVREFEAIPAPSSSLFYYLTLKGEDPLNKTSKSEEFLCMKRKPLIKLLTFLKNKDFEKLAEFGVQYKEIATIIPWIVKKFEFTRSGKKDLYILEIKIDQDYYCGWPIEDVAKRFF